MAGDDWMSCWEESNLRARGIDVLWMDAFQASRTRDVSSIPPTSARGQCDEASRAAIAFNFPTTSPPGPFPLPPLPSPSSSPPPVRSGPLSPR